MVHPRQRTSFFFLFGFFFIGESELTLLLLLFLSPGHQTTEQEHLMRAGHYLSFYYLLWMFYELTGGEMSVKMHVIALTVHCTFNVYGWLV